MGRTYKRRFARALHAVQAEEERGRVRVRGVPGLVRLQPLEQEGDAVLGFVVDDVGHVSLSLSRIFFWTGSIDDFFFFFFNLEVVCMYG